MEAPKGDYPTKQQIEDCFKAFKEGGEAGILAFLKNQGAERETAGTARDDSGRQTADHQPEGKSN
jgi:hypothetical protein